MLPEKLSTDLTSFNYHEDRPAMAIEMRFSDGGGLQCSNIYPGLFALFSGEHPIGSIFPKPELIIQLIEYGNIFLAVNEIDPQQAPKLVWLEDINQGQSLESTGILN